LWHFQDETFKSTCTCMLFFGKWPHLRSSHLLSKSFWQTFSMFSIVTRFRQKNLSKI
jgi:hypothetical protein